jgi:hypothetical protein
LGIANQMPTSRPNTKAGRVASSTEVSKKTKAAASPPNKPIIALAGRARRAGVSAAAPRECWAQARLCQGAC